MFTSRAEFRLHLRIDNADERLTPLGRSAGLVGDARWAVFARKREQRRTIEDLLGQVRASEIGGLAQGDDNPTLAVWLRRPEARISQLSSWIAGKLGQPLVHGVLDTIETEVKYAGYISQQERQITRLEGTQGREIPMDFLYEGIPGLSTEVKQRLTRVRPTSLGQARRIPGVTPAAIAVLDVYLNLVHVSRETSPVNVSRETC
jgi:tRNA uridine 5-carboxymethylaminomethyl modification enzyme